jgi:hypothetical protein
VMARFQDPEMQFAPLEVVERLLVLCEQEGYPASLYLSSDFDLVMYLDALGFDAYSLTAFVDRNSAINFNRPSVNMIPSGDKVHSHETGH